MTAKEEGERAATTAGRGRRAGQQGFEQRHDQNPGPSSTRTMPN